MFHSDVKVPDLIYSFPFSTKQSNNLSPSHICYDTHIHPSFFECDAHWITWVQQGAQSQTFNISVTSLHYFYVSYRRFEYYSDCLCILIGKFAYLYLCLHAFIVPASIFNYLKQCLCLDQSTIDQVDYKQYGFICFSPFWRLEVWGQGASMVSFWWDPFSGLQTAHFSL